MDQHQRPFCTVLPRRHVQRIEAGAPALVAERRVGNHKIEGFERVAFLKLWIGQRVALHDERCGIVVRCRRRDSPVRQYADIPTSDCAASSRQRRELDPSLDLLAQAWHGSLAKTAADTFARPKRDGNAVEWMVLLRSPIAQGELALSTANRIRRSTDLIRQVWDAGPKPWIPVFRS